MMVETFFPARAGSICAESSSNAYFTQTVELVWFFVFDFGFGERGFVMHAPVNRAQAFVNETVFVKRKKVSRTVDSYCGFMVA